MYGFLALGLYALADLYLTPRRFVRIAGIVAGMLGLAIILSCIQILPTLESLDSLFREHSDYSRTAGRRSGTWALPTLVIPDLAGAISDQYTGPVDRTQYYFYAGFLLLPLAILGLARTKNRLHALFLYRTGGLVHVWQGSRTFSGCNVAPVDEQGSRTDPRLVYYCAGFGYAGRRRVRLGAAALAVFLSEPAAIAILFVDVWCWNSLRNPLAYGRFSFDHSYGAGEDALLHHVVPGAPPFTRFAGGRKAVVGLRIPRLIFIWRPPPDMPQCRSGITRDMWQPCCETTDSWTVSLGIGTYWKADSTGVASNPSVLPRVYFPQSIMDVGTRAEALSAIETLNPHVQSVVLGPHSPVRQDPAATATVLAYDEDSYRILFHSPSPALLRLSVPYYAGWRASVEGKQLPIIHVDLAFMGVVVPAGDHELQFSFHSKSFAIGAAITFGGLMLFVHCCW